MAIVVENNHGYILNHHDSTKLAMESTEAATVETKDVYRLNWNLFKIIVPFVMDSQLDKLRNKMSGASDDLTRKRKRKRKEPLNAGEQMAIDYHEQVKPHIQLAFKTLLELARNRGWFLPTVRDIDNNIDARKASQMGGQADFLAELDDTSKPPGQIQECNVKDEKSILLKDVFNTLWHHDGDTATMVTLQSGRYILPPHSSFLMSDIEVLISSYTALGKFDLIVLDPPWENKSVKRKKKYGSLGNDKLLELPLGELSAPGCLVVVWVTNRCRHIQFVTEELFPRHGIHYLTKWFWLKVTTNGEMVCDFESAHKKPYETLVIGQYRGHDGQYRGLDSQGSGDASWPTKERTLISVPCSLHSKKPPLYEVLKSCLPSEHRCLELFARNLQSHWTSWGNEVILHQHMDFYEKVP